MKVGKMVWYGKPDWIAPPSKQLIVDCIAAGVNSLCEQPELVCKSFLAMAANSNLNDANDHIIRLEKDIGTIFDNEIFHSMDITAATANINNLWTE